MTARTRPRGVGAGVVVAGPPHRLEHGRRGRVEERDDALLLVVEVLVERRLRHAGLARDRLGRRVGVADAREDRAGGRVQPPALAVLAHLERRRMAAARCRVVLPIAHGVAMVARSLPSGRSMPRARLAVPARARRARLRLRQPRPPAGDFEGEEKNVADQSSRSSRAPARAGDAKEICDEVLAKQLRDEIAGRPARPARRRSTRRSRTPTTSTSTVEDVTISGDTATAKVKGRDATASSACATSSSCARAQDWRAEPRLTR